MTNEQWKMFFETCAETLGEGRANAALSANWCSWTTFRRLNEDAGYWQSGLPTKPDLSDIGVIDGSSWGQPFHYSDIAHIIIPAQFFWENISASGFDCGSKDQNIELLSTKLRERGIAHRKTNLMLEVKLY